MIIMFIHIPTNDVQLFPFLHIIVNPFVLLMTAILADGRYVTVLLIRVSLIIWLL